MERIRRASKHVETLELSDLIRLWDEHYQSLAEEDKLRLRLKRIAFLAPDEE